MYFRMAFFCKVELVRLICILLSGRLRFALKSFAMNWFSSRSFASQPPTTPLPAFTLQYPQIAVFPDSSPELFANITVPVPTEELADLHPPFTLSTFWLHYFLPLFSI